MKRIRSLILPAAAALVCALLVLPGCRKAEESREAILELPAAQVGDLVIPQRELYAQYASYLNALKSAGREGPSTKAEINKALLDVLEKLIEDRVEAYQASLQGYLELTPAQEDEVQALFASRKQQTVDYYTAEAESLKKLIPDLVIEDYVEAAIGSSAVDNGFNVPDLDAYWALLYDYTRTDYAVERLKQAYLENATVGAEEIEETYRTVLAANEARLAKGAGAYKDMEALYVKYGGAPVIITPPGYVRVKDICTASPEEAQAAKARLDAGEAFDEVLASYTTDTDFLLYDTFREKGKPLGSANSAIDWSAEVKAAVLALSLPGERTDIVQDSGGYHILLLVGQEPAGTKELAEVYDVISAIARQEKFQESWSAQLQAWRNAKNLVNVYKKNLTQLVTLLSNT